MAVVVVVNGAMMWVAIGSFPGLATTHGFDSSNGYDRVLAAAGRQQALGWSVTARLDALTPVVVLAGPDGAPLEGARLSAVAERPIGDPERTQLAFRAVAPGRFAADVRLAPGQWDLDLTVEAAGATYHSLRRVVAR
jgi:nitrogen fixation protein FixH